MTRTGVLPSTTRHASELARRADVAAGAKLERLVMNHHRRRLGRIGHLGALDARAGGWAAAGPPPRSGNTLDLLVDGAEALPRIADAVEQARSSVWLAGWSFSPELELRPGEATTLRELLADAAARVDVRMLAWAGAPLPLFRPGRAQVRDTMERLTRGTRIAHALDSLERPMHCHHEKLVIVDGELAFVGGIDLTSLGGDRLDESAHPARGSIGWHDVATRLRGPVVADVAAHFRLRWQEVTGEALPSAAPTDGTGPDELQIVRTVPEHTYDRLPEGEFTILESYLRALRSARELIYLENQFLWSPELVAVLAEKLRDPPSDRFRLLLLLPMKPNNGRDDTRGQLASLLQADGGAGRLLACTLRQRGEGALPVYVHAKVGIVDDRWLTIGSGNLNEHSLFNDTEMNVVAWSEALARSTRLRLWSEHLERPEAELDAEPHEVIDELWRPLADEQLNRLHRKLPTTRRLVRLPGSSRRTESLRGPLNGLLVDG
jgi:phosphatidylserine/phosphatidylglycerophosphate/cardiolipin synthase-like enzyme